MDDKKTFNNNISTWFIEKDCTFIILDKEKKGYQNFRWGDFGETKQKNQIDENLKKKFVLFMLFSFDLNFWKAKT